MASKVNVGVRSKAADQAAQEAMIETEVSTGKELVEENGQKWLTERVGSITIKTRIA